MKIILRANKDVMRHIGNVKLEAAAGKAQAFSPAAAETALSTGDFDFVREVAENDLETAMVEERKAENEAARAELLKLGKEELTARAESLEGYKSSMKKEELVDLILQPRAPQVLGDNPPAEGDNAGE